MDYANGMFNLNHFIFTTDIEVSDIITHSEFDKPHKLEHDIALIKLKTNANFSGPYIGAACLPRDGDNYRGTDNCWLSGKW